MSKLSYEDKIEIYNNKKEGISLSSLASKYGVRKSVINYLTRLIDNHGLEILRTTKNTEYTIHEKEQIINRILINNETIWSVALDEGLLSCGMLQNWVKKYKENGYNIVERSRGRRPTMIKKPKENKKETSEEAIKRLESENEYLRAELEYSKKLNAVVQQRKNRQQKKK